MKHINVFAPGTVANLGCGFDVMGRALDGVGDKMKVSIEEGKEGIEIINSSNCKLPSNQKNNVIYPAIEALLK